MPSIVIIIAITILVAAFIWVVYALSCKRTDAQVKPPSYEKTYEIRLPPSNRVSVPVAVLRQQARAAARTEKFHTAATTTAIVTGVALLGLAAAVAAVMLAVKL